jgi:adenylate kinase
LFQRSDDTLATAKKRLDVYLRDTKPIKEYYRRTGRFTQIDGMRGVSHVFDEVVEIVRKAKSSAKKV